MNIAAFTSDPVYLEIAVRLSIALGIGGLVGLERSYHGRSAGFRTHALVCLSTALLMLMSAFEARWVPVISQGRVTLDPTRLAQGIMTGIGFLGAGTIMKEGFSVRGLTTAASIWITAAIGILIGIGWYYPAVLATLLTLGTLSVFRWIEDHFPMQFYAHFLVRFVRNEAMPEADMRTLLLKHGFTVANLHYRLDVDANFFEYHMVIRSSRAADAGMLSRELNTLPFVKEFRVTPGD